MSDDTLMDAAKVVGGATGGGGLIAGLMQWLRAREAREARDVLIALQGSVERLVKDVEKLSSINTELTKTTGKADSAHERLDNHDDRIAALERAAFGSPPPGQRRPRHRSQK
jgi:hypothetical protein